MSAFSLARETAINFETEIVEVLKNAGLDLAKVAFIMGDLANTNIGHLGGICTLLSKRVAHDIVPATCDLHIINRALQKAFKAAFGDYQIGDAHVLGLAYQVAVNLDNAWPTLQPILQQERNKKAGSDGAPINKCPTPVLTRWYSAITCFLWIEKYRPELCALARYVYDYFPSDCSARSKWKDINIKLKSTVLHAHMKFVCDFGNLHYLQEMKWSESYDPELKICGFRAHNMAGRFLDRLSALRRMVSDRKGIFKDSYDICKPSERSRFDVECQVHSRLFVSPLLSSNLRKAGLHR